MANWYVKNLLLNSQHRCHEIRVLKPGSSIRFIALIGALNRLYTPGKSDTNFHAESQDRCSPIGYTWFTTAAVAPEKAVTVARTCKIQSLNEWLRIDKNVSTEYTQETYVNQSVTDIMFRVQLSSQINYSQFIFTQQNLQGKLACSLESEAKFVWLIDATFSMLFFTAEINSS